MHVEQPGRGADVPRVVEEGDERQRRLGAVRGVPVAGIVFSLWLITFLAPETWLRFGIWFGIGLVVDLAYGRRAVVFGSVDSGVSNGTVDDDGFSFLDHGRCVRRVRDVSGEWLAAGRFTQRERRAVIAAAVRAEDSPRP